MNIGNVWFDEHRLWESWILFLKLYCFNNIICDCCNSLMSVAIANLNNLNAYTHLSGLFRGFFRKLRLLSFLVFSLYGSFRLFTHQFQFVFVHAGFPIPFFHWHSFSCSFSITISVSYSLRKYFFSL